MELEDDIGSTDILDWKLALKKRNQRIKELTKELNDEKQKKAKDIARLMQEKLKSNLEVEDLRKALEASEQKLKSYMENTVTQEKFKAQEKRLKEVTEKLETTLKSIDEKNAIIQNLERQIQEETKNSARIKEMLAEKTEKLESLYENLLQQRGKLDLAKKRIKELEDKYMSALHDDKGKKIQDLLDQLDKKEHEITELKLSMKEREASHEKLTEKEQQLQKLKQEMDSRLEAERKKLQDEFKQVMKEWEKEVEELNEQNKKLQKDLEKLTGELPNQVAYGELECMKRIKSILRKTKRNTLIFVPRFEPHVKDLDLANCPSNISIRLATLALEKNELSIFGLKNQLNIEIRNYKDANLFGITSDGTDLFIAFSDKEDPPVGFYSSNETTLEFIGGLLRNIYSRLKRID